MNLRLLCYESIETAQARQRRRRLRLTWFLVGILIGVSVTLLVTIGLDRAWFAP